ncbi:MFS transporter [Escherichia coli]|nr:MFS transporter [Escherichia coli]MED0265416.1 MFS transporter [Escherichia coli]
MKNPYFPTALGLYFNYLVHGMGVILMSLNMASLETLWQTNAAGVSIVISSLGIGRLSVLLFAGLLSDRFGRRPFIMLGMCAAIWPSFLASCTPITSLSLMFLAFWREWQTVFSMQAPIPV